MVCLFCDRSKDSVFIKHKIYETETEFVVYNIRPGKNKGRCLIIPKRHVKTIRELNETEIASLFQTVRHVSQKLNQHLRPAGFNYGLNEGKTAGQTIEHLHFHIIPRYRNDDFPEYHLFHRHPRNKKNLTDKELEPVIREFRKLFK
jgi:diadenosine tetraphosphate (Ap4A) HIT family hydrolase